MIDQQALKMAEGYFRDMEVKIPNMNMELANTIANIFY